MLEVRPIPATGPGGEVLRNHSAQSMMVGTRISQGSSAGWRTSSEGFANTAATRSDLDISSNEMMPSPDLSADRNSHSICWELHSRSGMAGVEWLLSGI